MRPRPRKDQGSSSKTIVISDCDYESISVAEKPFAESGLHYTHLACQTKDEVIDRCRGAGIVMNQYAPFTRRVFAALKRDRSSRS